MHVRLSGAPPAIASARQVIGGDPLAPEAAQAWWTGLREQTHAFFAPGRPLWRLALPPTAAALGSGQADDRMERRPALAVGGAGRRRVARVGAAAGRPCHAVPSGRHAAAGRWRVPSAVAGCWPLIQRKLKAAFDPQGIFNPGRMHREF